MNDKERTKTVREILSLVASFTEAHGAEKSNYWGFDTEMDADSLEGAAVETLKKFEDKVREDAEQDIRYHVDEGGEI